MRDAFKHLWLGVGLIIAVSTLLLLSDSGQKKRAATGVHKWNVQMLAFVTALDSEDTERGMRAGLASRLTEGRDYEITVRNAQGDMPTLTGLVDAAISAGADLIMTLSTPTLQAAVQKVKQIPIVFSFSSNPLGAGAGRTFEDHVPNVTGSPTLSAFDETLALVREILPQARRLGTLVVPAEVNSVYSTEQLVSIGKKAGYEVVTLPVNSSSEVSDATLALLAQNLDAICQVGSNLTIAGMASITRPAQNARVPVFGFLTSDAHNGAIAVAARDYYEGGKEAGILAARIIQGEDPAKLPFQPVSGAKIVVNRSVARALGIRLPAALLERADQVLD